MIDALEGFVAALRRDGVPASPAEWIDALRAVEVVGLEDRSRLREALRCTLVKRSAAGPTFDCVFERWFATPARGGGGRRGRRGAASAGVGRAGAPVGDADARPASRPAPGRPPTGPRRDTASATPGGPPRDRARFSAEVARIVQGRPGGRDRLRQVVVANRDGAGRDPRGAPARASVRDDPTRIDLRGRLATDDESAIAAAVPRIVERLRLRPSRRARRSRRGRADWRHVFRANSATGGVPFVVPRRRARPRRTRIVLAVDVSWSTARSAALLLSIAGAVLAARRVLGASRIVAFVDRAVDATDAVAGWLGERPTARLPGGGSARRPPGAGIVRGGVSFAGLIDGLTDLDPRAPSDYGRAFHDLLTSPLRPRGRGTLLVVLGDGRTNRFDPQSWAFEELAAGCGAVVWLVCEPVATWCDGDSALDVYLPACDVAVEARDLRGLERGVAALAARL